MKAFCALNSQGETIASTQAQAPLIPASNTKLFSAAAALLDHPIEQALAPAIKLSTDKANTLHVEMPGNLYFSGRYQAEPLEQLKKRFQNLASTLKQNKRTQFSALQLSCEAAALAPLAHYPCVSFLSINENTLDLSIDETVNACPDLYLSFEFNTDIKQNQQSRSANTISFNPHERSDDFWRLESDNWTHPLMIHYLSLEGIQFDSTEPAQSPVSELNRLATLEDPHSLGELIQSSLCYSDNFRAELIALHLRRLQNWVPLNQCLKKLYKQAKLNATQIIDGSGLLRDNQTTALDLCKLHLFMDQHSQRDCWHQSLSIAGQTGTLKNTYSNTFLAGRFKGKSGTLNDVRSLSGILTLDNSQTIYLSFLQNDRECSSFKSFVLESLNEIITQHEKT